MLDHEIADFGRRMGIENFSLNSNGLVALDVERFGRLCLERVEGSANQDTLLIYVTLPIPAHDADACRRVLALCALEEAHAMPVWGGVHNQHIVLLVRLPADTAQAADMENAALFLRTLLARVV